MVLGALKHRRQRALLVIVASLAAATMPLRGTPAMAGTYVIDNCPAAPGANGDPGPWVIFSSPQASKGSCSGGSGDWIGPRSGSMSPGSADGVQVTVPTGSGITIREAKVWWAVPHQQSGADTFAVAYANGASVDEAQTAGSQANASVFALASSTTTFRIEDYCSNDDAGQGCLFGGGEDPNLQLFGSQLTLADSRPPTGHVSGGGLASNAALSGTQSIAYGAEDADTGVRLAQLLIDGQSVAVNGYIAQCPYTDFQACPVGVSGTISWNTATVTDGQHDVQLAVEDAAQNTSTIYDATITTHNAPLNTSPPAITAGEQPLPGSTLSAQTGQWSAPPGAGNPSYAYQWESCDSQGQACETIPEAKGAAYSPTSAEVGRTARVRVTATDSDGSTSLQSEPSGVVGSAALTTPSPSPTSILASVGAANGLAATEAAQLQLTTPTRVTRTFADRALAIIGALRTSTGAPIAGATLDVREQAAGGAPNLLIGHADTTANGSFTAHVAGGPSRLVTIGYRALSTDAGYAAQGSVRESVDAGVQMHVTPTRTSPTGTIAIEGRISGPSSYAGVLVELLVHYRGQWVPFRTARTNAAGRFRAAYQFQGARGRFPFRAEIPGGQASFPYTTGYSEIIAVHSG